MKKKMITSNADKDAEKLDHSYIAGRKMKWYIHSILEKSLAVPFKTKNRLTRNQPLQYLGIHLRETKTYFHRKIAPNWKLLKFPSMDEQ